MDKGILPIIYLLGSSKPEGIFLYALILITLYPVLVEAYASVRKRFLKKKRIIIEYDNHEGRNRFPSIAYTTISWKLSSYDSKIAGFNSLTVEGTNAQKFMTLYTPTENTKFKIPGTKLTAEKLKIAVEKNKLIKLILEGTTVEEIKDFIEKSEEEFRVWRDNKDRVTDMFYTMDNKGEAFEENKISFNKTFENIFYDDKCISSIRESVETFLKREAWYDEKGLLYKRAILLHGPPGTGKTSMIQAFANKLKRNIYKVSFSDHDKVELMNCLRTIPENEIIMVDDFDRQLKVLAEETNKTLLTSKRIDTPSLLSILDGYDWCPKGTILFFTANDLSDIAVVTGRAGRIDEMHLIDYASHGQIEAIFRSFYPEIEASQLKELRDMPIENKHSTAYLINTVVLPNNCRAAIDMLKP